MFLNWPQKYINIMIFLLRGSNHFGIAGHYAKKALGNITFLWEISGTDIYTNVHFSKLDL